jgi:porin
LLGGAAAAGPARAEPPASGAFETWWDGLPASGIAPMLTYQGDFAQNVAGGSARGATYGSDIHLQVALDGARRAGLSGLSAWLDAMWLSGGQPSLLVGDAQGVNDIAARPAVRLYEAWVQYNPPGSSVSILGGRYDLNTEFYRLASADLFFNSSFGIGPEFATSGFAGPSFFPDTALGVRFAYKPGTHSVLRVAVLDAAPLDRQDGSPKPFEIRNGVLVAAEAALVTRAGAPATANHQIRIGRHADHVPYDDKIAVGVWTYTARFAPTDAATPPLHRDEAGAYILADRKLWQDSDDPDRRLTAFLQAGADLAPVERFGSYVGAGVVAFGMLAARPHDQFGAAVAVARNSEAYIIEQEQSGLRADHSETVIEVTYLAQFASRLAVQPDAQYVIHPNTDPRLRNATVLQLRFAVTY